MHRIFVVGCPRSGTTLTQSLVASHGDLVTLPETHFFAVLPHRWWLGRCLGLASAEAVEKVEEVARHLGRDSPESRSPIRTERSVSDDFVALLDRDARARRASGWVEKTPYHLRRVELISSFVPDARYCHVLRRGPDVVASLYHVTQRHPEAWGGSRSLEACVERWIEDTATSLTYLEDPFHVHVRYHELVNESGPVVEAAWESLGLAPETLRREEFGRARQQAEPAGAPWQAVGSEISPARGQSFREVLDQDQQDWLLEVLRRRGEKRGLYWKGRPLFI